MKELTVFQHNTIDVVDSRQVAEMIGRRHDHLIRDIKSYCDILSKTTAPKIGGSIERNFAPNAFFIESTYKDSTGRTLPCYLLTKKGCDMVANKMTGEKGVLFTAALPRSRRAFFFCQRNRFFATLFDLRRCQRSLPALCAEPKNASVPLRFR